MPNAGSGRFGSGPGLRMSHPRKKGFGSGLFGAISFAIAAIRAPKANENNGFAVFDVDFDANWSE